MKLFSKLSKHYLFRNASISASLAMAGALSGLVLDALILSAFGVGYQTDAYATALTIPLLLSSILSIQCPKVLVPVFSEYFSRNDQAGAWKLLSSLVTTGMIGLLTICLIGIALCGVIVPMQIPGLDSQTMSLAVSLSKTLFFLIFAQGLASIMQSVLYARHSYSISSSGKLVSNLVAMIVVLSAHSVFGIKAVAAGMLLGSFVQVLLLGVVLSAQGFRYRWIFAPADPKVREIITKLRNPAFGHILGESGALLQNVLGSFFGSGSVTVLRYASRIVQAAAGILLGSVVQVTLPLMAKHASAKNLRLQKKTLLESLQLLSVVGVPLCAWLMLSAGPLVVLLFQRGEFSAADAALTSLVIQFMVGDILFGRMVSVTQTLFYANSDTRTPLISTLIYTLVNTVAAIILSGVLGVLSVPIAVSLASLSNTIYMVWKLQKTFAPIGWGEMRGFALRLAGSCILGGVGFGLGAQLATIANGSVLVTRVLAVAMPTALGMCVFIVAAFLFRLINSSSFPLAMGKGAS